MCGIVGYIGPRPAAGLIVSGLHRLEYRGYDSSGVALIDNRQGHLDVIKTPGKITALEACLRQHHGGEPPPAGLGIGHTRWATHGPPSRDNAHPHLSQSGEFAVVHNGIIENYTALKMQLERKGYTFASQTDSEVIAHLIEECYEGDLRAAVAACLEQLDGTYGIAVISSLHPDTLVAARRGSPIAAGICDDGGNIVASDICAIVNHTTKVIFLDDGDVLTASRAGVDITSIKNVPVSRELTNIDWDLGTIERAGYPHFMLKEINEQPISIANAMRGRLLEDEGTAKLSGMQMDPFDMARIDRIAIAACGTSYYAGMAGKYFFEDFAGIPAEIEQAAEFRYRNPIVQRDTMTLAISQSGETADTLAAVREAKRKGSLVLGICNVVGSTIARESGRGIYLHAGPEIGVASTKSFTSQVAVLAMMAITLGRTRRLSMHAGQHLVRQMKMLPDLIRSVLGQQEVIRAIAEKYYQCEDFFYIGRGYMFPAALEGALKLKEISYIHAEGYHAAELKHGPIALLEEKVPVVALCPDVSGKSKTLGNMQECRARSAPVIAICTEGDPQIEEHCDDAIRIPRCEEFLAPIPVVVAEQLFAYHVADLRGCPIDQPRNLAKSVTVE